MSGPAQDKSGYEAVADALRDVLARLYDPTCQPPIWLLEALGCNPAQGIESLQALVVRAIEELRPAEHVPADARSRRLFDILDARYLQGLSQEEAAERLNISPRHVRREQGLALQWLVKSILKEGEQGISFAAAPPPDELVASNVAGVETRDGAWRSQMLSELSSLHKQSPASVADLAEVISGVLAITQPLASKQQVVLKRGDSMPGMVAALHPSALRQILVGGITELLRVTPSGEIAISAQPKGESVDIRLSSKPTQEAAWPLDSLLQELVTLQGGHLACDRMDDGLLMRIVLPCATKSAVLVIDDNQDLVHFYQRYAHGTRYEIVPVSEGARVLQAIESLRPDLIVLDIMLPDVDGWELLVHLHEHSATRSTPIIVCSVVREEELALALGATLYLPKPVGRVAFLQALDQALSQTASTRSKEHASSATAC
jgi:CheY-like chemotaxis protein